MTSCIIWDNSSGSTQNCNKTYCWENDPCFIDSDDPNEFHLGPNSPCIDAGDSNLIDPNETDIDGEDRIMKGKTELRVDIGADEYYWPKCDYDKSGIVNFVDFTFFAAVWQDNNDTIDLDGDPCSFVDIDDLKLFCNDWLWVAPWSAQYEQMMMAGGSPGLDMIAESTAAAVTSSAAATAEAEPLTDERIKELIEWTEDLLQDPELTLDETRIRIILDSLKAELEN